MNVDANVLVSMNIVQGATKVHTFLNYMASLHVHISGFSLDKGQHLMTHMGHKS